MLLTALHEAMRTVWALDLVGVTPTLWKGQIWRLRASLNCFSVFGMEHLLQGRNCQARDTSAGYPILSLFVARCIPLCPYRRIKLAVDIASQFSNNSKVPHQTTKRIPNTSHPPKPRTAYLPIRRMSEFLVSVVKFCHYQQTHPQKVAHLACRHACMSFWLGIAMD